MDLTFTDEQLALKELAVEFFEKEVRPVAAELDAQPDPRNCFPAEIIRKASMVGLRTLGLPEEYGGAGANVVTKTMLLAAMTEIEPGTAKVLSQGWKVCQVIAQAGNDFQKKKFLTEFAEDHDFTCSILLTEPNAGSDNVLPCTLPGSGLTMKAVRDGGDWLLNGVKHMSSLVSFSKLMLVYARTAPERPVNAGVTAFLVPADTPGITYGQVHNKMGYRLYPNGESYWDNVRVPNAYLLGELNQGLATRQKFGAGVEIAAMNLGILKAIYRIALEHARTRVQGGRAILGHPTVGSMIAELGMLAQTVEGYLYNTLHHIRNDAGFDRKRASYGTLYSRECLQRAIMLALDILGGVGIMRDHPMEKLVRDGLTFMHASGTNSLLRLKVANSLQ